MQDIIINKFNRINQFAMGASYQTTMNQMHDKTNKN